MRLFGVLLLLLPACTRAGFDNGPGPEEGGPPVDRGVDLPALLDGPLTAEAVFPADMPVVAEAGPLEAGAVCTKDGVPCTDNNLPGICHAGACCTGCWDGVACRPGTAVEACATGGQVCKTCAAAACAEASCVQGTCSLGEVPDGTKCKGGVCHNGACCTGCWDTSTVSCQPGTADTACGSAGDPCTDCTPSGFCNTGICVSGA